MKLFGGTPYSYVPLNFATGSLTCSRVYLASFLTHSFLFTKGALLERTKPGGFGFIKIFFLLSSNAGKEMGSILGPLWGLY